MIETDRRVAVTLIAATDEPAHQVMAGMLDAVRNRLPELEIHSTSTSAFEVGQDDETEPCVQLVVDVKGGIIGAWVDNPDRAEEFARNTSAVAVSLPIEADHR